jgi:hypothetical protein
VMEGEKRHFVAYSYLVKLISFFALIFLLSEHCSVLKNISESIIAIVGPLGTTLSQLFLRSLCNQSVLDSV